MYPGENVDFLYRGKQVGQISRKEGQIKSSFSVALPSIFLCDNKLIATMLHIISKYPLLVVKTFTDPQQQKRGKLLLVRDIVCTYQLVSCSDTEHQLSILLAQCSI